MPVKHLMLYDGECGFCNEAVRFVLAHDRRALFHFAALQSPAAAAELAPFGGDPADLTTFYVIERWRSAHAVLHGRSGAALVVASAIGWPWKAFSILRVLPRPWRDAAYDLVARHRHRLLSGTDACIVPSPEQRARFIDAGDVPQQ